MTPASLRPSAEPVVPMLPPFMERPCAVQSLPNCPAQSCKLSKALFPYTAADAICVSSYRLGFNIKPRTLTSAVPVPQCGMALMNGLRVSMSLLCLSLWRHWERPGASAGECGSRAVASWTFPARPAAAVPKSSSVPEVGHPQMRSRSGSMKCLGLHEVLGLRPTLAWCAGSHPGSLAELRRLQVKNS